MTLALYGKSRGRQRWLLLAAVLAIVAAVTFGVAGADSGRYAFAQDGDETTEPSTEGAPTEGATEEATEPPTEEATEPPATEEATEPPVTEEATEESTQGITQESATAESQTQDSQTEDLTPVGATLNPSHVGATAPGFQTEGDCGPFTGEFDWAFHFVFQGSSTDFTSIVASFTGGTVVHSTFEGKHAFVYVNSDNGPITLDSASATTVHNGGNQELDTTFNLSHICEGEGGAEETTLTVIKTVNTNNNPEFTGVASDFSINVTTDGGAAVFGPFMGSETGTVVDITSPGQTFRVTEADTRGYNLMFSGDCTATGDGISADVFVAAGEHKTCTLTNTAPPVTETEGTLNVIKVVDTNNNPEFTGAAGDFQISVQTDGGTLIEGPFSGEGAPGTAVSVPGGQTFQVIEPDTRGYNLTFSGDCAADGTVFVDVGQTKTCTLTNTAPPVSTLNVIKVVDTNNNPEFTGSPGDFMISVQTDGGTPVEGPFAGESDPGTAVTVPGGQTFQVIEPDTRGYNLTFGGDCAADGTVFVDVGQTKTCTLTNTAPDVEDNASIIVRKEAGDDEATLFPFTFGLMGGAATSFDLEDDAADTNVDDMRTFGSLGAGVFVITDVGVDGWSLTDITCTSDGTLSVVEDMDAGTATVTLAAGENVECIFTNAENPVAGTSEVTIVKDAGGLPNSAVSFTVEGFDGLTGFDLDDDPATATPNIQVIPGISDDTFTVTEGLVAGWELADIVCVNDADEEDDLEGIATASLGDREVVFDIGANLGLSITCTFFNEQAQVGETPTVTPTTPATETPTVSPTTETPTVSPTTETPTASPTTETPTVSPTTETPTASPTTETPTASPTTPATATEETTVESLAPSTSTTGGVIQESAVGGATPIAPSTGTGTNAAEQTATLGLIIAGLVAMTAGASLLAIRRRS
jgi:outer membrane biosynthesis protein TonB